jgi:hypothetical protein
VTFPRAFLALSLLLFPAALVQADVTVAEKDDRVRVEIDGKLFTEYRFRGAPQVYFYPLIGPGGAKMTRSWPMEEAPNEEHDHPHHRSLWFAHGLVNGVDFWTEPASFGKKPPTHPLGQIVHQKFLELRGGAKDGVISSLNHWVAPEGVLLQSVQTVRVHAGQNEERLIDFEVTLTAADKEVVLGDTKEGSMAVRINESMRMMQPGKKPGLGHALNSEGQRDGEVWGKRAAWVDYSGPVDGQTLGIAFFDHPGNPGHPNRWHARDYGLFAANPFCAHEMDKTQPAGSGARKIAPGASLKYRYRLVLHAGDGAAAQVAQRFADYCAATP